MYGTWASTDFCMCEDLVIHPPWILRDDYDIFTALAAWISKFTVLEWNTSSTKEVGKAALEKQVIVSLLPVFST